MFSFLEWFGIMCIIIFVYRCTNSFLQFSYNTIGYCLNIGPDLKMQGQWALVTGATDGIGKAFAEVLASRGINIILISRSLSKLEVVASEIKKQYKVESRVIEADFTKTEEIYEHIKKNVFGYEIGILVNNVGSSYPYPDYFLNLKENEIIYPSIVNCNIYSVINMCKIVMPGMLERKRGIVINISSTAAIIPSPMLTVYGASKAFIEKFSKDLSTEYSKDNIIIQCLMPGYVATKMSKIRKSTWMAPAPHDYVKSALKMVGIQDETTGYYPHTFLVAAIHFIQYVSPKCASNIVIRIMSTIRARAIHRHTV